MELGARQTRSLILNRGIAEEARPVGSWRKPITAGSWPVDPAEGSALYNLGNVQGESLQQWKRPPFFEAAAAARPGSDGPAPAPRWRPSSQGDLAGWSLKRVPSKLNPSLNLAVAMLRAGLTALLWLRRDLKGRPESNLAAPQASTRRYRSQKWLAAIRRWPPITREAALGKIF